MSPVALIIGAGSGVGKACAESFSAEGYQVAVASRTGHNLEKRFTYYQLDASHPSAISHLFERVKMDLGVPNVVIYNAYTFHGGEAKENLLTVNLSHVINDFNVNTISPYLAAGEAVKGWQELEKQGRVGKQGATFIYTGNVFPTKPNPHAIAFCAQKAAVKNIVLNLSQIYREEPYKFYWGDERASEGGAVYGDINGPLHGETYLKLAEEPKQQIYDYTFVKGKGYVKFDDHA
ncbi:putative short-chain dehydrogenase [Kockovaella imperatae]|uniref:Putative short-chain dehydrogenase n=1 Tax=Kockovaella imperatae TaxID=4999 RepID=A0A1Y1U939_9TREE|nr:putative short-chain dehydrogenase [Kockovaella imperatae]ORX34054.1 putative short-chain dehydrogenase [Kockovaella imperatae]